MGTRSLVALSVVTGIVGLVAVGAAAASLRARRTGPPTNPKRRFNPLDDQLVRILLEKSPSGDETVERRRDRQTGTPRETAKRGRFDRERGDGLPSQSR